MTPGARAAAAIEVLDVWLAGGGRAERLLRDWGRSNRYAGSKDRRAIQDIVYTCLRRKRSCDWSNGGTAGRGLVIGYCLSEGINPDELFSGQGYAPPPLTDAERQTQGNPVDPVRFDHPDWLEAQLKAALGSHYEPALTALGQRAPLDLRVNTLKTTLAAAQTALANEGVETDTTDLVPTALRALPGARVLATSAYEDGLIEIQDAASQAAIAYADVKPGMTILDYCAGGGGKTLALAAAMKNTGKLIAHDIAPDRMVDLPARAKRAGAKVECRSDLTSLRSACDLVFVDAPCSGSGTWRREPEAKWSLTPDRLADLCDMQREAFEGALTYVKPGGAIIYATCSILAAENETQAEFFAQTHDLAAMDTPLKLIPGAGSDGFFAACFRSNS